MRLGRVTVRASIDWVYHPLLGSMTLLAAAITLSLAVPPDTPDRARERPHGQIAYWLSLVVHKHKHQISMAQVEGVEPSGVEGKSRIQEAGNRPRSTQALTHLMVSL